MNTEQFDGHTPGPWDTLVCATTGEKMVIDGPDEAFANCLALVDGVGEHDVGWKNMALIAAAPDLLAKVKRLREELNYARVTLDEWDKTGPCVTVYHEGCEYVGCLRLYKNEDGEVIE